MAELCGQNVTITFSYDDQASVAFDSAIADIDSWSTITANADEEVYIGGDWTSGYLETTVEWRCEYCGTLNDAYTLGCCSCRASR